MKPVPVILVVAVLLVSCATSRPPADTDRGPGWYTVKRGETLYSISWRYGLDYHQVAEWNGFDPTSPIYPGQRLRMLKPHNQSTPAKSTGAKVATPANESKSSSTTSSKSTPTVSSNTASFSDPGKWIWPTTGKPLNSFLATRLDRRGIDIAGKAGQSVVAVADGKVVYSGNGLAGYGNLIIIKHSETYLSAYAYCQQRLVEEGTLVKAGRQVATMGKKDNVAMLHFEIRRNGKPVDPLKYLPKQ